jgi:hypothetical protein
MLYYISVQNFQTEVCYTFGSAKTTNLNFGVHIRRKLDFALFDTSIFTEPNTVLEYNIDYI